MKWLKCLTTSHFLVLKIKKKSFLSQASQFVNYLQKLIDPRFKVQTRYGLKFPLNLLLLQAQVKASSKI